jgi:hypothetical protein
MSALQRIRAVFNFLHTGWAIHGSLSSLPVGIHSCWIVDVPSCSTCSKTFVIASGGTPVTRR